MEPGPFARQGELSYSRNAALPKEILFMVTTSPDMDRPASSQVAAVASKALTSPVLIALFFVSLLLPIPFWVADVYLNPQRLFMLAIAIPITVRWLSGKAGQVRTPDILFGIFSIWMILSYLVANGPSKLPFAIMQTVELFVAYLVGRVLIRNLADYRFFFKCLIAAAIVLFPFTFPELLTGNAIMLDIFKPSTRAYADLNHPPRLGFWRVQSVFQHPIMFGVFFSIMIVNVFVLWRKQLMLAISFTALGFYMTFASLSSGALLAGIVQMVLVAWGWMTGRSWKLLMWLVFAMFVFLSIASNRGPIIIMIETLAFSSGTGWTRVLIWTHAKDDVMRHWLFGMGANASFWTRPHFLGASVDNFWLVIALRHGLVGFGLLASVLALNLRSILKVTIQSPDLQMVRIAYVIGCVSLFLSLATVHIWGSANLLVMAYFGAGAWMIDASRTQEAPAPEAETSPRPEARSLPYSRGPRQAGRPGQTPPASSHRRTPHS